MTTHKASLPLRVARVAAILVALVVLGAVIWLFTRDSRQDLQPEIFVGDVLLEGAVDVTASTCGAEFACESAWGTDELILMKFATKNEAAIAARSIGADAYRSDWLVANFVGESVSEQDRRYVSESLDGTWQSEVD